jgi:uncharacterized protein (TIGR02391 family)
MGYLPCFASAELEAVCKVLGDTVSGLTGPEIAHILLEIRVDDVAPSTTKWKRLFNALACKQNQVQAGNFVIQFINKAMAPAKYVSTPDLFHLRRDGLNVALAFAGYRVREDGQVAHSTRESTVEGARARAGRLRSLLESRSIHTEVLRYCKAELLEENYFHAVLEAVKGITERLRFMSGLGSDGAELVNAVFSVRTPILAINSLKTDTEQSEQKGIDNMLVGIFGAIRNPVAHAPKTTWAMPEQDAIDVFGILSYVHRKLDGATKI